MSANSLSVFIPSLLPAYKPDMLPNKVCEQHNLPKVVWDESQKSVRPYNARVSNQKMKTAGYQLIHAQMII